MSEHVTNRQIAFFIFFTIAGYTVIELPKIMAESAGTGAWFVLMLASVLFLLPVLVITYLNNTFKDKTWFEYSKMLVGRIISYIFLVIYLFYTIGVFAFINRVSSEVIRIDFLRNASTWQISFLMIIIICYALSKGFTNLLRLFEFYGVIILVIVVIIHTVMFTQGKLIDLQPFFRTSQFGNYLMAVPNTMMPYLGFEMILLIPFTKKNKKVYLSTLLPVLAVGFTYIIIVESVISVIGIDDVVNYTDSLVVAIRRIDIRSLQFLQRFDSLFVVAWFMAGFCTSSAYAYGALYCMKKLLPKAKTFILLVALGVLSFVIGAIPGSHKDAGEALIKVDIYLGLFVAILMPMIFLITAKVKKNGEKNN